MSTIRVEIVQLEDVRPHLNAESLELATVKGWQLCVKKGQHQTGDKVVYFEAGTVLPIELTDRLGVTSFMNNKTDINGDKVLVVGRVKLRGEPSFGLAIPIEDNNWEVGQDVAEHYQAIKFKPPVKSSAGDADEEHPLFPKYTDIENLRNFPNVFQEGEYVEVTEKLHGTNVRVGFVINPESGEVTYMAGSRELRRKRPENETDMEANTYWFPHTLQGVQDLLQDLYNQGDSQAVLYGEVYGANVQKGYDYGHKRPSFGAFCLMVNGKFINRETFRLLCEDAGIYMAPVLYSGPFSLSKIKELSEGPAVAGGTHIREGVVVRPLVERSDPQVGRVILKYVSDSYLFGKNTDKEDTTDQ